MICDTCFDAITNEGFGDGFALRPDEIAMIAQDLGAEIPDHCCEDIDDQPRTDDQACECACHPRAKALQRADRPIPYRVHGHG